MIRIYDLSLNLIAEIDVYSSLSATRSFYKYGQFELKLDFGVKYANELKRNRLLILGANPDKVFIIQKVVLNIKDKKEYTVSGFEFKSVLAKRIVIPPSDLSHQEFIETPAETVIKDLVTTQCLDTLGMEFPDFEVTTDTEYGSLVTAKFRYKNLAEELENVARLAQIGLRIYVDFAAKKFMFDIIKPLDRSANVVFARIFDNIDTMTYEENDINSVNSAIVGGSGEGASRIIGESSGIETGFLKSVTFVDAGDISDTGDLITRADQRIAANQLVKSFDCMILNKPFEYEKDWNLGDFVTIRDDDLGITEKYQVEEVTEWYTAKNPAQLNVVFGKKSITIRNYIDIATDNGIV